MLFTAALIVLIIGLIFVIWPVLTYNIRGGTKDYEYVMTAFGMVLLILGLIMIMINLIL